MVGAVIVGVLPRSVGGLHRAQGVPAGAPEPVSDQGDDGAEGERTDLDEVGLEQGRLRGVAEMSRIADGCDPANSSPTSFRS